VDLPPSTPECYEDASAGPNPAATHDCGWPAGWVRKLAWAGAEDKWPTAFKLLGEYQINNAIQQELLLEIDVNNVPAEEAIEAWMDENPDIWQSWITAAQG
jgi:glycine betaine/proline transport system substrate-binding protein